MKYSANREYIYQYTILPNHIMSQEFEFIPEFKSYTEGHLTNRYTPEVKVYEQGRVDDFQKLAISSTQKSLMAKGFATGYFSTAFSDKLTIPGQFLGGIWAGREIDGMEFGKLALFVVFDLIGIGLGSFTKMKVYEE